MKNRLFHSLKALLLAYMIVVIVLPMGALLRSISIHGIVDVFTSSRFIPMLRNSLITTFCTTLISVPVSFLLALLIHRSHVRCKGVFVVLFTIPMLIPSISHGTGLVLLFGDNGLLTNLLGVNIGIYGHTGIVMGSVLYSFPVSFLIFHDSFQYEDFTVYEAADVLGISKIRQFLIITLPYMAPAIVSAALAVFTMVFTDYGVPLMTGGTYMTLPVYMYREVIGMTDFSSGSVIGMVLLLPALGAFLLDYFRHNPASSGTIVKGYNASRNKGRDILIFIGFMTIVFLLCLPIFAFVCLGFVKRYPIDLSFSLDAVRKLMENHAGIYVVNSLAISLLTALVGVCLAYLSAYITTFGKRKALASKILHFLSMLPMAFPGLVLGLSFVLTFKGSVIYSTLFILVIVNVTHFFSSPYILARNALAKFDESMNDAAQTLGVSRLRMLVDVYIPCTMPTIVEMYSYFFVNSMITISAVSFLFNFRTMPLSLLIPQLESQSFVEGTALVSMLILAINLLEKGIAFVIRRKRIKQDTKG